MSITTHATTAESLQLIDI